MNREEARDRICANAGCRNEVGAGGRYCDTCELEWLLYRRDLRAEAPGDDATP